MAGHVDYDYYAPQFTSPRLLVLLSRAGASFYKLGDGGGTISEGHITWIA